MSNAGSVDGAHRVPTLSAGVAAYPDHAHDMEGMVGCADVALYEAKRTGRDRVVLSSNHMGPVAVSAVG